MAETRRARRMERHHKAKNQSGLNLVSLMDIFTILVFFLLVNSSSTPQLPSNKALSLPRATAEKPPEETLIIAITKTDILVQGNRVASVRDALASEEPFIPALTSELTRFAQQSSALNASANAADQRRVTIMADEDLNFELIDKILGSCQRAKYNNVAFAATQVAKKSN